jgi:DNA-binding LacI/PurR family transcriptional regulator
MSSRPTLADVARAAGVSRSAVSRVVNDQPGVTSLVRQRVWRVVRELGYRPDPVARALASGQADVVDVVIVDDDVLALSANPHYARVLAGVTGALGDGGAGLRVRLVDRQGTDALSAGPGPERSLGALLVNVPPESAGRLRAVYGRIVSAGRSAPRVPYLEPDNTGGIRAAVHHLYRAGRRRIAAVDGPSRSPCAVDRRTAYPSAVRELGPAPVSGPGDFTRATALRRTRQLLPADPGIDAVVAACDLTAAGVLQALAESGRRVPDDVAVVGFDDSVLAASASVPLTSVASPVETIAAEATRFLLGSGAIPGERVRLPVSLTVRRSSVPAG